MGAKAPGVKRRREILTMPYAALLFYEGIGNAAFIGRRTPFAYIALWHFIMDNRLALPQAKGSYCGLQRSSASSLPGCVSDKGYDHSVWRNFWHRHLG